MAREEIIVLIMKTTNKKKKKTVSAVWFLTYSDTTKQ